MSNVDLPVRAVLGVCGLALAASVALAQPVELPTDDSPIPSFTAASFRDSGLVQAAGGPDDSGQVVAMFEISSPGAPWIRINFSPLTSLAGDPAAHTAAHVRITSVEDGDVQTLNSEHLGYWANSSAFFNGDTVIVELVASPGTPASRLVIDSFTAGVGAIGTRSICGTVDDRQLSSDPRVGRVMTVGCSAWLINDLNNQFLTAGHCGPSSGNVIQFNVPLSLSNGSPVNPPAADQYPTSVSDSKLTTGSVSLGSDWTYFATSVNSQSGLTAAQVQQSWFTLSNTSPSIGSVIRITGYGTTSSPVSPTWNQVQKTHAGAFSSRSGNVLYYNADTTGGNSGSPVINESAGGVAVGIHTNGGCGAGGGNNSGTWNSNANLVSALANPIGLLKTGSGTPAPGVYAIGDGANNFGTLNTATGNFAKLSSPRFFAQGLTWDWSNRVFYAVSSAPTGTLNRNLYTVTESGVATFVAPLTGTTVTINALAYNPSNDTLYGWIQGSGRLCTINTSTGAVSFLGSNLSGTNIGAMEFDQVGGVLYGINDTASGSLLVTINPADGTLTNVGFLGAGINDCNGLAFSKGFLYTINATNEQALRVDPATGAATPIGATGGLFASSFGMAATGDCPADMDGDGAADFGDFLAFFNAFDIEDPAADRDGVNGVEFADFLAFFNFFDIGC